jgi:tetratricopeptide (TPR) repeat protein
MAQKRANPSHPEIPVDVAEVVSPKKPPPLPPKASKPPPLPPAAAHAPSGPPPLPPPPVPSSGNLDDLDKNSIDKLLALTDDGWDIDEQVKTLQRASNDPASVALRAAPPTTGLVLPTAGELAPAPRMSSRPPPPLVEKSAAKPSKPPPPPLPGAASAAARATARPPAIPGPPPVPGAKRPPPIPGATSLPAPPPIPRVADRSSVSGSDRQRSVIDPISPESLVELLSARIGALESTDDKVGRARAHVELSVALETLLGDDARATAQAEAALTVDPASAAAHGILRRRKHSRGAIPAMLGHLDAELLASTEDAATVELLAERARLLEAKGDDDAGVRDAWDAALARAKTHAAALKGLESALFKRATKDPTTWEAYANHLGVMADAYESEPRFAAWLHVERAHVLEHRLQRIDGARSALERAVELDPSIGPIRAAALRHVAAHDDASALAALLEEEAQLEHDAARAARLELDAAILADARLGERARAITLLERATMRSPTVPAVDRRVLDELTRLYEAGGDVTNALRVRRLRLRYFDDPRTIAEEHRVLASHAEKAGDLDGAILETQKALGLEPTDPTLLESLDRLLVAADRHEPRIGIWLTEAARNAEGAKRAKALLRAATIAEELGRRADAVRHLRAAWVGAPGDAEVLDALSRLLTPTPSERLDSEARALLELYAQAASHAHDTDRRIAYLEKAALLWENTLGDPRRALAAYEEILTLEPNRRSATLGVHRNAVRVGDDKLIARSLLDEARLATDGVDVMALEIRAATALAKTDPARALSLVEGVLAKDPDHVAARTLETRLHEEAGRFERVASSLKARIATAERLRTTPRDDLVRLWFSLAEVQRRSLKQPAEAVKSLQSARKLDPAHPMPPLEIARILESGEDQKPYRDALEALATDAKTPEERSRFLVLAAEVDEYRLRDDASAQATYVRALAETPDDDHVAERLARVLARRAAVAAKTRTEGGPSGGARASGELCALALKRLDRAATPEAAHTLAFDAAVLLVEQGKELTRAASLLESVVTEEPTHVPALRLLEAIARQTNELAPLARTLSRQGDALRDVRARLGALWALASLEEWRMPASDGVSTYGRILELDPTDPGALDATFRKELPLARRGDAKARLRVVFALRTLFALACDDGARLALQLRLALLIEAAAESTADPKLLEEARDRYRMALHTDPLSVTAATGLARLATRLRDAEGAFSAAVALADIAGQPKVRGRYLLEAAELLLTAPDERLGARPERRARAAHLLERSLEADPDSIPAAGRLSTVWTEDGHAERLVDTFRTVMTRAQAADAIVMLGSEIARVARDELKDLTTAIDAMRAVRAAAPQHVPSLLTLAELCIAQRAWPEAVDALEAVVTTSRESGPKMTALFALASVYERVLDRKDEAERSLRLALSVEPSNPRALRALLRFVAAQNAEASRPEQADLLGRLAEVERDPEARSELLVELASLRSRLGERALAEKALIHAVACAPGSARIFSKLASHHKTPQSKTGRDEGAYARALREVIAIGQRLGRVDASWFATLGQIEVTELDRVREGIGHLQQAVAIEADLYETRFELASAFGKANMNEDATRTILAMIHPTAKPLLSLADPAAALALLERSLSAERRSEEALAVSELRAITGDLDEGRHAWLRGRSPRPLESGTPALDRATLVTHVLPVEGRHVLLEVAAAVSGVEAKMLRADLGELGIASRDRISSRSGHPTRLLLDRLAKQLGISDLEFVVSNAVTRTRILAQDDPWIVVPESLTQLPPMAQLAAMGKALVRVAYGVPWIEELPAPHIEAFLIAAARQAVPGYGGESLDVLSEKLVGQYEASIAKALSRKHRRLLEELAPHIASPQGRPPPIEAFIAALGRAELRAAYLLTGDLLATIDDVRSVDPHLLRATEQPGRQALGAVLDHPYAGDAARFAMSSEAAALKRRFGSAWATG